MTQEAKEYRDMLECIVNHLDNRERKEVKELLDKYPDIAPPFKVLDEERMTPFEKTYLYAEGMVNYGPTDRFWQGYLEAMNNAREWISSPPQPSIEDGKQEPVMSEQLAAEADMAALDFGRLSASPVGEGPDGSELTDAYEAGQNWMWRKLQAEISSLKETLLAGEHVVSLLREQIADKDSEIELLRKSGASLRPGISIPDVLKWMRLKNVHEKIGMWQIDGGALAYTDERLAEVFLEQHPGLTPDQLEARLEARSIAFGDYLQNSESAKYMSLHDSYHQFLSDETEKNERHQPETKSEEIPKYQDGNTAWYERLREALIKSRDERDAYKAALQEYAQTEMSSIAETVLAKYNNY